MAVDPAVVLGIDGPGRVAMSATDRFRHEQALLAQGLSRLAGVDEVGRGPLAGPVVAAAVVLPAAWYAHGPPEELVGLNDSKQLTDAQRRRFAACLTGHPEIDIALAVVEAAEIDALNILRATHAAMARALAALRPPSEHVLVDGLRVATLREPQTALVGGDGLSYSIAAASVVAKVTRDRMMEAYDRQHPGYGFARHKGYGTPEHLAALRRLGPCPLHRRSFAPCRWEQGELFL